MGLAGGVVYPGFANYYPKVGPKGPALVRFHAIRGKKHVKLTADGWSLKLILLKFLGMNLQLFKPEPFS